MLTSTTNYTTPLSPFTSPPPFKPHTPQLSPLLVSTTRSLSPPRSTFVVKPPLEHPRLNRPFCPSVPHVYNTPPPLTRRKYILIYIPVYRTFQHLREGAVLGSCGGVNSGEGIEVGWGTEHMNKKGRGKGLALFE